MPHDQLFLLRADFADPADQVLDILEVQVSLFPIEEYIVPMSGVEVFNRLPDQPVVFDLLFDFQ